jgi:hypothetical protein
MLAGNSLSGQLGRSVLPSGLELLDASSNSFTGAVGKFICLPCSLPVLG